MFKLWCRLVFGVLDLYDRFVGWFYEPQHQGFTEDISPALLWGTHDTLGPLPEEVPAAAGEFLSDPLSALTKPVDYVDDTPAFDAAWNDLMDRLGNKTVRIHTAQWEPWYDADPMERMLSYVGV